MAVGMIDLNSATRDLFRAILPAPWGAKKVSWHRLDQRLLLGR